MITKMVEKFKRFIYCLNGKPYISLPFADDFKLITRAPFAAVMLIFLKIYLNTFYGGMIS